MEIDTDMVAQLGSSGEFESMRMAVDEVILSKRHHAMTCLQALDLTISACHSKV